MKPRKEEEFISMINTYNRVIYKICCIYATDSNNVNDLYQETVLNLWKGYENFKGQSKVSSWIYRVGINTCISFYRRNKKHLETIPLAADHDNIDDSNDYMNQLKEMYRLINQLNKIEKAIILLWLDEKPYDEIADVMGMNKNTIASKLKRIREKLAKLSNE
jgi:RNA polymerase sigma factor, sigma-70 family